MLAMVALRAARLRSQRSRCCDTWPSAPSGTTPMLRQNMGLVLVELPRARGESRQEWLVADMRREVSRSRAPVSSDTISVVLIAATSSLTARTIRHRSKRRRKPVELVAEDFVHSWKRLLDARGARRTSRSSPSASPARMPRLKPRAMSVVGSTTTSRSTAASVRPPYAPRSRSSQPDYTLLPLSDRVCVVGRGTRGDRSARECRRPRHGAPGRAPGASRWPNGDAAPKTVLVAESELSRGIFPGGSARRRRRDAPHRRDNAPASACRKSRASSFR